MRIRSINRAGASALAAAVLCGALGTGAPATAADAQRGREIAERWCAACHLVSPQQERAMDGVPSFGEIAGRGDLGGDRLEAFLASPHPPMPDMALTRAELGDLAAYIDSLAE